VRCVEALLDAAPALSSARDDLGRTPVHRAAMRGSTACLNVLRERGAVLEDRDELGRTPLHLAVAAGQEDAARELLRMGADVAARDTAGLTALHFAADADRVDIATLLLRRGIEPGVRSKAGHTASVYGSEGTRAALEIIARDARPPSIATAALEFAASRRGVFGALCGSLFAYQLAVLPYLVSFSSKHTHMYSFTAAAVALLAGAVALRMIFARAPWVRPPRLDVRLCAAVHVASAACIAHGVWYSHRLDLGPSAGPDERHYGPLGLWWWRLWIFFFPFFLLV
jgi:hypothetical protein